MRRLLGLLLLSAAGCSGFAAPATADFKKIGIPSKPTRTEYSRIRFRMSLDSPALAGEFEGAVVVKQGEGGPVLRIQLFGDVGPKVIDLMARSDRIVGLFPQSREGVDCALPSEASPHLMLFMGVTLLERFAELTEDRILGWRQEGDNWRLKVRPVVPGMAIEMLINQQGSRKETRLSWMYGVSWTEGWVGAADGPRGTILAPNLSIHLLQLEESHPQDLNASVLEVKLPDDVRIVKGSRK